MCGIAGIISTNKYTGIRTTLESMCKAIEHRGPDGQGVFVDDNESLGFGHRRLAIIDLSNSGAQPMKALDRYTITFNGEIYNYLELKANLQSKGHHFETQTDTEVLIHAYNEWGEQCLGFLDGMFAFAIYDRFTDEIFCARDRFGEKPFFYTIVEDKLYFASEIKCFWAIGIPKIIEEERLFFFLAEDLVENPLKPDQTFYKNILQLPPAHFMKFKRGNLHIELNNYWSLNINEQNSHLTFDQAKDRFFELLDTSLKRRLRSDVRVGCSLSGGLDSSSVVALIHERTNSINTVSARFENFSKDEGEYIAMISQKFHTNHSDVWIDENAMQMHLDRLIYHQDEPFQTGSILAQYLVYQKAKEKDIIVMLDGQGADELLGGYEKDFQVYARELFAHKKQHQAFIGKIASNHNWPISLNWKDKLLSRSPQIHAELSKVKRNLFRVRYKGIEDNFANEYAPKKSPFEDFSDLKKSLKHQLTVQGLQKLLRFADRNSMAHSIEVRLPFLFHELSEFVMTVPSEYLLFEGWSKALLRESMTSLLPSPIVYRKNKIGFEAPQNNWLNNQSTRGRIDEAKQRMISERIITAEYSNDWKILIASYYL
jgi:asparagine synthase (glutamine-hydrolysing)